MILSKAKMTIDLPIRNRKNPNPAAVGINAPIVGDIVTVKIASISANLRPNRSERYPKNREPHNTPTKMIAA